MSKPAIWDTGQPLRRGTRHHHVDVVNALPPNGSLVESAARKAALKGASVASSGRKHAGQEDEASYCKTYPSRPEDPFDLKIYRNIVPVLRPLDWLGEYHDYVLASLALFITSLVCVPLLRLWITHPLSIVMNIAMLVAFGRKLPTLRRSRELVGTPSFLSRGRRQGWDTGLTAILGRMEYEPDPAPQFQHAVHPRVFPTVVPTSQPPPPYSPHPNKPTLPSRNPEGDLHKITWNCPEITEPRYSTKSKNNCADYNSCPQTDTIHVTPENRSITVIDISSNCDDSSQSPCSMVPANELDAVPPSSANNFDILGPPGISPSIESGTEHQQIVPLPITDAPLPEEYPTMEANTGKAEELGYSIRAFGTNDLDKIRSSVPKDLPPAIEGQVAGIDAFPQPISSSCVLELLEVAPPTAMIGRALGPLQPIILAIPECRAGNMLQLSYPADSKIMRRTHELTLVDLTKYILRASHDIFEQLPKNSSRLLLKLEWEESSTKVLSGVHVPRGCSESLRLELRSLLRGHEITSAQPCYKPRKHSQLTTPGDEPGSASATFPEGSETTKIMNAPSGTLYEIENHLSASLPTTIDHPYEERLMVMVHDTEIREVGLAPASRGGHKKLQNASSCSAGFGWEPGGSGGGLDPFDFSGFGDVPGNLGPLDGDAFWQEQDLGPELLQGAGLNNDPLQILFGTIKPAPDILNPQPHYHDGNDLAVRQPGHAPPPPVPLPVASQSSVHGPEWSVGFAAGCEFATRPPGASLSRPQDCGPEWSIGFIAGCEFARSTSGTTQSGASGSQADSTGLPTQAATPQMPMPSTSNNNPQSPQSAASPGHPI
ncbi:hypothetical protein FRC11_001207, partial [Ceratobasidium sp. 423]